MKKFVFSQQQKTKKNQRHADLWEGKKEKEKKILYQFLSVELKEKYSSNTTVLKKYCNTAVKSILVNCTCTVLQTKPGSCFSIYLLKLEKFLC